MTPRRPDPGNRNNCTHGTPVAERAAGADNRGNFVYDACGSQRCVDQASGRVPATRTEAGPLFQGMQHDPSAPLWDFARAALLAGTGTLGRCAFRFPFSVAALRGRVGRTKSTA